jgi:protein-L-isoaspartate(D-aspartate) O-methyltransferase
MERPQKYQIREVLGLERSPNKSFLQKYISPYVTSDIVLNAFVQVDRADFVPEEYQEHAYTDAIIPVAEGSSISQPSLVAKMIDMLQPSGQGKILEVGTASGYGAALLSRCASEVHTIEISSELAAQSQEKLAALGYQNITVHAGDGAKGMPEHGPFKAIIVTAGARSIPSTLIAQLEEGGRIVIPVGPEDHEDALLVLGIKKDNMLLTRPIGQVTFVPLVSNEEGGWSVEAVAALQEERNARYKALAEMAAERVFKKQLLEVQKEIREQMGDTEGRMTDAEINRKLVTDLQRLGLF